MILVKELTPAIKPIVDDPGVTPTTSPDNFLVAARRPARTLKEPTIFPDQVWGKRSAEEGK